jgi:hypothetical protein
VQNSVPLNEMGQATSASQFMRQIGSTVGAAVVGTVFSTALAAGFLANLPSGGALPVGSAASGANHLNSKGPTEIRLEIEAGIDQRIASIDRAFALRGSEARAALDTLLTDEALPAEMKSRLAAGTPAMQIDSAFQGLGDSLEKAVNSGDAPAVAAIIAAPQFSAFLGAEQKAQLLRLPFAPPSIRSQALTGIRAGLSKAADVAVARANSAALAPIHQALAKARIEVADSVVNGIRRSFSDSIHQVWLISIIVMALMLLLTLLVPNIALRSKNDYAVPGGAAPGDEAPGSGDAPPKEAIPAPVLA